MTPDRLEAFLKLYPVPKIIYDIGANDPFDQDGQQNCYKKLLPNTRFFLFEAAEKHRAALIRSGESYAIATLGEHDDEEKVFYETTAYPRGSGDSLYLERTDYYAPGIRIETTVRTSRLDSIVSHNHWPLPDFIKIDVQGSELDVLRGAPVCLNHAIAVEMECCIQQYNQGAPMIHEQIAFMAEQGFRIYDITSPVFNSISELMRCDVLFLRSNIFKDRWLAMN